MILDRRTLAKVDSTVGWLDGLVVQLSYPSMTDVLIFKDFDLRNHASKTMTHVRQSRSGKSFLLALMIQCCDPLAERSWLIK